MSRKKIVGKMVYQNLETGFWSIVDEQGGQYRPVQVPEQLKKEGKQVTLLIEEVDEGPSLFMWGTPVKIVSFTT